MGLSKDDRLPTAISLVDAYSAIRTWYLAHVEQIEKHGDDYSLASAALIRALPVASAISNLEIIAILREVIAGYLEWAYHQSDGNYKMAAYAYAALDTAGRSFHPTREEIENLKASFLWPFLSPHLKKL